MISGKPDGERCPDALGAGNRDRSAVEGYSVLHDRKPQPGSADLPGMALVGAVVALKDTVGAVRRNADTRV